MAVRLTVAEQVSRNAAFKGRPLAVKVIDPTTGYIVKAEKLFAAPRERVKSTKNLTETGYRFIN